MSVKHNTNRYSVDLGWYWNPPSRKLLVVWIVSDSEYRNLTVIIRPGLKHLPKGFRKAYKRRGVYPRRLITGIEKAIRNKL